MNNSKPIKHYRRFPDYDYSGGATLFISLSTSPRRQLFGEVINGEMKLSAFGQEVKRAIEVSIGREISLRLYGHTVLPDHLHFRVYLSAGYDNQKAISILNQTVGRLKSYTTHLYQTKYGGASTLWQKGYHDWLCVSREMVDSVERYIAYNALKWWLRHGAGRSLMALHEPIESPRLGRDEYWRGVGAVELLNSTRTMVSLRVSRRCSPGDITALIARISAKAGELVILSGFISPGERAVLAALMQNAAAQFIKVSPAALPHDYAPSVALMAAIAEGRCAIIARGNSPEELSRAACLDLNARIIEIADRAAYVLPGEVSWLMGRLVNGPQRAH